MRKEIDYRQIGYRLRIERERFNMTREALSEFLDISPHYLGQIERGERKISIKILTLSSICLNVSTDYLLFGPGENNNTDVDDLYLLLSKCSKREINSLKTIVQVLLPHLNMQQE
jgi:transcriptional regulator with XRE-family HTH domain